MNDTMAELHDVFREVFDDPTMDIDRETSARDVEAWDSLMHVELILNVERVFNVRFTSSEVAALQNVGELADLIDRKRGHA